MGVEANLEGYETNDFFLEGGGEMRNNNNIWGGWDTKQD